MAFVNFSIPDSLKTLFNKTFCHVNKSALIAELMREAIEREQRRLAHDAALHDIVRRRDALPLERPQLLVQTRGPLSRR